VVCRVQFVSLASITDPGLVATALADALEIQQITSRTIPQLIGDQLQNSGPFLLLLDNSGRTTLSEFTGDLVDAINEGDRGNSRTGWGRWLGDLGFAPSSEVSSIEHDTKQVRRNEGQLSCSYTNDAND
jgi:hypothetical protein